MFYKILKTGSWLLLPALWALAVWAYFNLPEIIPTHFNARGQADVHGSKESIFTLPVIGTVIFFILTLVIKFPNLSKHHGMKIKPENEERMKTLGQNFMIYLRFVLMIIFLIIIIITINAANSGKNAVAPWILPLILGIILIPTINFIYKSFKLI